MESGGVISLCVIADVTATYQNQEMLEYLKNDAPMGAFKILMDKYFTTIYATDTFYAIHGFTREEYNIERVGRSVNYMPPEDVKVAAQALYAAYEAGEKSMAFEMRILRRDGSHGWLLTQCSFVDTVDGPVMYGFVTDNTVVKRQQEEIQELERICSFTLNQDYENIYLFDTEKNEYRNVSSKGITRKELLSKGVLEQWYFECISSLPEENKESALSKFELETVKQQLDAHSSYQFLFRKRNSNGEMRRTLANYRYYDDRRIKIILCIKDVEEEEQQKEALTQLNAAELASRAKSEFLSRMSHDIRTPLNTITGSVEIVKTFPDTPQKVTENLCNIESASKFLLSLINDVLDMNKIESGKMRIVSEAFDLSELIRNVTLLASGSAGQHSVTFHCDTSPELMRCYVGDELRLKQVLMNLLSNAMKYSKRPGGEVWLRVRPILQNERACGISFVIEDNGIGMSEEFIKNRMWQPFEREHDNVQGMTGSGLGLTIVKNIIELMQGTISVRSTIGRGSVFTINLPLLPSEHQPKNHELEVQAASVGKCFNGQRILLAEDHDVNATIIKTLLERYNLIVERACNGKEATRLFLQSESDYYSVILMDIRMPVMDGLEATGIIRHSQHLQAGFIPIFALSANAFAEDIEKSRQAGMQEHLSKPIEADTLFAVLQKYL